MENLTLTGVVKGFATGRPPHSLGVHIPKLAAQIARVGPGTRFSVSVDELGRVIFAPLPESEATTCKVRKGRQQTGGSFVIAIRQGP